MKVAEFFFLIIFALKDIVLHVVPFHLFVLLGRRLGGFLITRLKLYEKILPPETAASISEDSLHSASGQLKSFAKYAKLSPEVTDKYRIFTLKIYWNIVLCVLYVGLLILYSYLDIGSTTAMPLLGLTVLGKDIILLMILILGFLNFSIPFSKFIKLRQRFQSDPTQSLLHDMRKPILYLRSFHHDSPEPLLEVDTLNAELGQKREIYVSSSPEEKLVTALQQVGPVVAVGRPGETLPQLGAIRFYFSDEEWQGKVMELMSLSQFVVLQAGHSQGTEWEMVTVKNTLQPQQVIFSFVHWQKQSRRVAQLDYDIFRMQVDRLYGQTLPEKIGDSILMWYDSDWTPHFVKTPSITPATISEAFNSIPKETGSPALPQNV